MIVSPNEEVRNYEDSPKVTPSLSTSPGGLTRNPLKRSLSSTSSTRSLAPESFEKLRAKMIPYDRPMARISSGTLVRNLSFFLFIPPLHLSIFSSLN